MKGIIQDINELSDSRELLESKPHKFVLLFLYIFMSLLVAALVWTYFGEKDVVVKANGNVRPNEGISFIRNKVLGKVERVNYKNGQFIKKGTILYTIENNDLIVQKKFLEKDLLNSKRELSYLEKLKKSVETGENYFLENNSDLNNEYYQKFLKYDADYKKMESELKKNKLELEKNNHENSIDQNSYRKRIEELKVRIDRHLKLEQSILQNDNLFKVNDVSEKEYYHKYLEFESKVKKYTQVIKQKEENYEIYKNLGEEVVPKKEIQDRKNELEAAALELKVFKDEYLSNLRTDIEKYRRELTELEYNLKKTDEYNSYYKNDSLNNEKYSSLSLQQYKNNTLVNINDGIKGLREKIKKSEEELKLVNINIEERIVKAPIDGKINILMEINKGDLLQPGTEILTIIPNVNSEFKVQLSVLNKDIADIKEGSLIKYHFLALPYKEYGELTGKITKISTDSNVSPQDGKSYYNVEATIENRPLHSYKGKVAYIKVGMAVEAHVVTKTQKILYYMLEKINLRD